MHAKTIALRNIINTAVLLIIFRTVLLQTAWIDKELVGVSQD